MPPAFAAEPSIHRADLPTRTNQRRQHRPALIFQGGGYDGCIFEWNALFFQSGTPRLLEAEQPGVSGRAGRRVVHAAQGGLRAAVVAATAEGDWHLCTTEASWLEFDRMFNKGFVRSVCKLAQRECRCDKCQRWFDPDEIVHTGYRGNGGVGVQFDDNHCLECADELHERYCAENLWKYESVADRVRAIQQYNEESASAVSIFSARHTEAPVKYRFYAGEPEYY